MPRCAEESCGRWRPERLAPRWATGIRFNSLWYCSRACVEHAVRAGLAAGDAPHGSGLQGSERVAARNIMPAALPPLRLGVLLRHLHAVTEDDLTFALEQQRRSGRRLGEELLRLGLVEPAQVVRALAAQSNVSYLTTIDMARVKNGPAWLRAETVRLLGLVPFDTDVVRQRVKVVCEAPVPRAAIRALHKLTGWTPEVYLVGDDVFKQALAAYQPAPSDTPSGDVMTVSGVDAATAIVVDTAVVDREVTMRAASCEQYTWVRVEGTSHVADVFVPGMAESLLGERRTGLAM